jgi:hypothetical protein
VSEHLAERAARSRADLAAVQLDDVANICDAAGYRLIANALRVLAGEIGLGSKPWHVRAVDRLLERPSAAARPARTRRSPTLAEVGPVRLRTNRQPLWGTDRGWWKLALQLPDRRGWWIFTANVNGTGGPFKYHSDRDEIVHADGWTEAAVHLPIEDCPAAIGGTR